MEDEVSDREHVFSFIPIFREIENSENEEENDEDNNDPVFTQQQIEEFERCFQKIDKENTGYIPSSEVSLFLRATGLNPTLKVIRNVVEWLQENKIDKLNFDESIRILKRAWDDVDPFKLRDAVDILDRARNGFFKVDELKDSLVNIGECLDESEFKELVKQVKVRADGTINSEDLIKLLTTEFKR